MSDTPPPTTIEDLFFRLDKRLALIEAEQLVHCKDHTKLAGASTTMKPSCALV